MKRRNLFKMLAGAAIAPTIPAIRSSPVITPPLSGDFLVSMGTNVTWIYNKHVFKFAEEPRDQLNESAGAIQG